MLGGFPEPKRLGGAASGQRRAEVARALNALGREVVARTPGGGVGGRMKMEAKGWSWVGSGGRGGGQGLLSPLQVNGSGGRARVTFGVVTQSGLVVDRGRVLIPEIGGVPLDEGAVLNYPEEREGWVVMRLVLEFTQVLMSVFNEETGEYEDIMVFQSGLVGSAEVEWRNGGLPEADYDNSGGVFYLPMAVAMEEAGKWWLQPLMQYSQVEVEFTRLNEGAAFPIVAALYSGWPAAGLFTPVVVGI